MSRFAFKSIQLKLLASFAVLGIVPLVVLPTAPLRDVGLFVAGVAGALLLISAMAATAALNHALERLATACDKIGELTAVIARSVEGQAVTTTEIGPTQTRSAAAALAELSKGLDAQMAQVTSDRTRSSDGVAARISAAAGDSRPGVVTIPALAFAAGRS